MFKLPNNCVHLTCQQSDAQNSPCEASTEVKHELSDVQAVFKESKGTRDQIANIRWIIKKAREFQKNIYFCFIDYTKAFDRVDPNKLWKILKEMGIPDHHLPSEKPICRSRNNSQKQTWNNELFPNPCHTGKEYDKAVYCHLAYLTSMQSTSRKMPGCMKHKLESRLPGEISINSDMQMTPSLWQKAKRN